MSAEAEETQQRSAARRTIRRGHAPGAKTISGAAGPADLPLFQPFNIPSGSMDPDVARRRLSLRVEIQLRLQPLLLPVRARLFSGRIWAKEPQRGDVVVFKLPRDNETDYIKR